MILKIVAILMAVASYASVANGQCCGGCPASGWCPDGTRSTPFIHCCATGPCNIFCCNCQGECREPSFIGDIIDPDLPAISEAQNLDIAVERFHRFDKDKNGAIDIGELRHYMPTYISKSAFQDVDVNGDGKVTIEEFDKLAGRSIKEKLMQ